MNLEIPNGSKTLRCINVINFIRGVEPRGPVDLLLPVQRQMELILSHRLPATWLLQFDALVAGPFVEYLKSHRAENHEVGFWFEMNEKLCDAAQVQWRGRPGYEWDSNPPVAFTIGYTPEERIKLADAAMRGFKQIWGRYPSSIASWNLDSITIGHLTQHYGIDAYAVCRDQIATDGFTIWGAPIAGYYPSKTNCWSPALSKRNQISTPIFRMLGQDPVYYYDNVYRLPDGREVRPPDTMEPVWVSGRSPVFVKEFLRVISEAPTLGFAYAQLGQENSFGWPDMAEAYPMQMEALAALRDSGSVHVETMGESGRRFKSAFSMTPAQAQVELHDPFGNTENPETTVWYQSRFYRANLHFKGNLPYLRDITVYSDRNEQPFLLTATRDGEVEQRMPAVLDGYHWRNEAGAQGRPGAGGCFTVNGQPIHLAGPPGISERAQQLRVELPLEGGKVLEVLFEEKEISMRLTPASHAPWSIEFQWDPAKSALSNVRPGRIEYRWQGFDYAVLVEPATASSTSEGWSANSDGHAIRLRLSQPT